MQNKSLDGNGQGTGGTDTALHVALDSLYHTTIQVAAPLVPVFLLYCQNLSSY